MSDSLDLKKKKKEKENVENNRVLVDRLSNNKHYFQQTLFYGMKNYCSLINS